MFIVKVPAINGKNSKGCERTGNVLLTLLKEFSSNEQGSVIDSSILDLEEIHLDNSNLNLTNELIYKNSLEAFDMKPRTIFLGGDHSITYSIGKAFMDHCNKEQKKPCLILFSSYADCSDSEEFATDRNWLRMLIEKGFPKDNVLLVGVRKVGKEEMVFIGRNKIKRISMNSLIEDINDICDTIMEFSNGRELYISIGIDIIDPVFAPATCYPEIGGLTSRQFLYLIQRIKKIKTLRGVDITNINSEKDKNFNNLTTKLGVKILTELI